MRQWHVLSRIKSERSWNCLLDRPATRLSGLSNGSVLRIHPMINWNKHYAAATTAFLPESLQKRLTSAVLRRDMRLLAISGYSVNIPSSKMPKLVTDNLIRQHDYRLIRGTSDRILGTVHAKFNICARYFAEAYNDILFCNFRQDTPKGMADVRMILDSQDWREIKEVVSLKITKDEQDLEFISSFRKRKNE